MKDLTQHGNAVDSAGTVLTAARAALSRGGQPIFSAEEQARLEAEAEAEFRRTFTDAAAAAGAEIAEAEAELHTLDRREADPLGALLPDDLTRARSLATFVKEDCEILPVAALADRVEDAAKGTDRAASALLLRYGQRRVDGEQAKPGRGYSDDLTRLEAALTTVRARLFGHGDKRAALVARRDEAQGLQVHATTTQYIAQRYGGR